MGAVILTVLHVQLHRSVKGEVDKLLSYRKIPLCLC